MSEPRARVSLVYCRISEDREGRELGVTRQEEDCAALAEQLGRSVIGVFIDNDRGASTRSRKPRPEYRRLLAAAEAAAARQDVAIIAYTTGRLTRRPRENEDLIDLATGYGVRYEYVRSPSFDLNTSAGRRIARTLAAQDAGESEDIAERVERDVIRRAHAGLNHGGQRAFGYSGNGMDLIPAEAVEVERVFTQMLSGIPGGSIARELTERGVPTVSGKPWIWPTVRGMLMNPRYAGLRAHLGEVVGPAQWPAIVTEDVWRAACGLLDDPARRMSTGNRASYLLSGLGLCGWPGCPKRIASSGSDHPNHPGRSRQYTCRPTRHVNRRMAWVDEYVRDVVLELVTGPKAHEVLAADDRRPDLAELRVETQALRVRLEEFAADRATGLITRSQMIAGTERVRARLAEVEPLLVVSHQSPFVEDLRAAADPGAYWDDGMTLDERRAVVASWLTVTLLPGGKGKRGFDPTKVKIEEHRRR